MDNDLISREALRKAFHERIYYFDKSSWDEANALIDSAETVDINQPAIWWNGYDTGNVIGEHERPQKVVTIPHELIEKLVLCVVDTVENIDWDKAIEAYKERPTGEREFIEILAQNVPEDLCTYPEYKGKPYYSIHYKENGEDFVGFGTYNPEVLSRYLRDYFMRGGADNETDNM